MNSNSNAPTNLPTTEDHKFRNSKPPDMWRYALFWIDVNIALYLTMYSKSPQPLATHKLI